MRARRTGLPRVSCSEESELLDRPAQDVGALAGNLDDLSRVNRWLGGVRLTYRGIERLAGPFQADRPLSVLDAGTGAADIPMALAASAERAGVKLDLIASDVSPTILKLARARVADQVTLVAADVRRLPFLDDSLDVVTCSLMLHHFDPDDAVAALREMRRVSRLGIVVNDLIRSRRGYLGAVALGYLLTRNPLTRHDGPLSVRRAYTRDELRELAVRAGLDAIEFDGFAGYRAAMTARKYG